MLKKIIKRILISIPVLIGVVLVIFIMLRIVPGNPIVTMLGEHVNQQTIDKLTVEMGLDQPAYVQFFKYVWNALHGDFGTSYRMNRSVTQMIMDAFPYTVKLSVLAALISWTIGVVAGVVAAIRQNRILDRLFMGTALLGVSMPIFMAALLLQYVFAYKLQLFPISGYEGFSALILPAIALGMEPAGRDLMSSPPRPREEGLFAHGLTRTILLRGTLLGLASSLVYGGALWLGCDLAVARSACFLTIVFSQMVHLFECRDSGLLANPLLLGAAGCSLAAAAASVYLPALQTVCGTASVTGQPLLLTAAGVVGGPLLAALARCIFRLGRRKEKNWQSVQG